MMAEENSEHAYGDVPRDLARGVAPEEGVTQPSLLARPERGGIVWTPQDLKDIANAEEPCFWQWRIRGHLVSAAITAACRVGLFIWFALVLVFAYFCEIQDRGALGIVKFWVFLTNWGFLSYLIYFGAHAWLLCSKRVPTLRYKKRLAIANSFATVFAVVVMVMYWTAVFPTDRLKGLRYWAVCANVHGLAPLCTIADFLMNRIPVILGRKLALFLTTFTAYALVNLFTTLYWCNVYPVMTYKDVMTYVWLLAAVLLAVVTSLGARTLRRRQLRAATAG